MSRESLIVGVGSHAVAVDPTSGSELWRTKLKTSSFVTVHTLGDRVFCGAGGELFCLDSASGTILWRNKLKGLGMGLVSFTASAATVSAAAVRAQQAAAASAAASGS
jgi:outer membrane protein assembly factor BamB